MQINKQRLLVILVAVAVLFAVGYVWGGYSPIDLLQEIAGGQNAAGYGDTLEELEQLIAPEDEAAAPKAQDRDVYYYFASQQLFDSHYEKHGSEFGNITQEQYLDQVNALMQSQNEEVLTKTRSNGDVMFYRETTNEFAVKTVKNVIKTYFKPSDGIAYYNRQH